MGKHKAGAAKTAASAAASETSSSANELRTNTAAEKTEDRPGQWVVFGAVLGTTHIIFVYLLMFANCNVLSLLSILLLSPVLPAVHHRMLAELAAYAWRAFIFWAQIVGGLTPVYSGDLHLLTRKKGEPKYPGSKLVIGNHLSFTDSFLFLCMAQTVGEEAHVRAFAKKSLAWQLPVVGWTASLLNFIFLSRNFEKDKVNISKQMKQLAQRSQYYSTRNYWLTIFPEGTRCRPDKLEESQAFAKSRGLPVFKHVLVPRMKGLLATLGEHDNTLRNSADAVIDCTFGYPLRRSGGKVRPSVQDILLGVGRRWKVHMHVRVIPMASVPREDQALQKWILGVFEEKDELLEHYKVHGCFPGETFPVEKPGIRMLVSNLMVFTVIALAVTLGCHATYSYFLSS